MSTTTTLRKVTDNIWVLEGQASLMPGVKLPARATVVRLSGGDLLIHSPIVFSGADLAGIRRLGDVSTLLAPNLFHHLYLADAQKHFPDAQTIGAEGLAAKSKNLTIDQTYGSTLPASLRADFEHVEIHGAPKFDELVLCHRASRTLIVADYFFNIHDTKGLLTPLLLKMTGSYRKATQSKLWRRMTTDRRAMATSAKAVLALDYQRVIMCHGDIVEDGRAFTASSLRWILENRASDV